MIGWLISACVNAYAATPITLLDRYVGHTNYVATGGSFRTNPNTINACSVSPTSSATVSGIPDDATIRAVYLYWVGSGNIDSSITLNGNLINAQRTDTAVFNFGGTAYNFFSGFAEISNLNLVTSNGAVTVGGLNVTTANPYCSVQVVTAGWSLYVVYDEPNEPLHAVNIFDGFQFFRGSAINLTASGFRIPSNFVSGRFTFSHYDGDPQNSTPVGGFSELLSLNGNALDDGIQAPASNPVQQPYDGTINGAGISNSHGVDIDTYNVTALLSPGDTQATVTMSAGGDLVLSTGMIIAVNTEPVTDLALTSSQTGPFTPGQTGTIEVSVMNNGPEEESNEATVSIPLPTGLSFDSASGGNWICTVSGTTVDCLHPAPLAVGNAFANLVLNLLVDNSIAPTVSVPLIVSSASLDTDASNDSSSEDITVLRPDLSTSIKLVSDLNGGDAEPGDTLRYTVRLTESAGIDALGVSVDDDMPALVENLNIVSAPTGSTDTSSTSGGANSSGVLTISDILVPANTSVDIIFDVDVVAGVVPGDIISNLAQITNPNGPDTDPLAPNVVVQASQITASGTKTLYFYGLGRADPNGYNNGPAPYLSRTPPATDQGNVAVDKNNPVDWRLTPALQSDLSLDSGVIPVTLLVSKGGGGGNDVQRSLQIELFDDTSLLATQTLTFAAPASSNPLQINFALNLPTAMTVSSGTTLIIRATNTTVGGGNRRVRVFPISGATQSRIDLNALTVINIDSLGAFDQPYPLGTAAITAVPGQSLAVRAQVSDPFGTFDIANVVLDVFTPAGSPFLSDIDLTRVADSNINVATFETIITLPAAATSGNWSFAMTAIEGEEAIVTHSRNFSVEVQLPTPLLTIAKTVSPESDPVNGTATPFNIPGAIVVYSIVVTNSGAGSTDAGSLSITDLIPTGTRFVVASSGDPVEFQDGPVASGLNFDFASDVSFSNTVGGGAPFDHALSDIGDGTDPDVTAIEIRPSGALNADSGGGPTGFTVQFRVKVAD